MSCVIPFTFYSFVLACEKCHWLFDRDCIESAYCLVCCCLVTKLGLTLHTPWTAVLQASLSCTVSQSLLRFMFIESVILSNHLILCLLLFLLLSIFPNIRVFCNDSALHIRWPKYWSFSFGISPSIEHSGFVSFRIDLFDLLAKQETLKSSLAPQFKGINFLVFSLLYGLLFSSIVQSCLTLCNSMDCSTPGFPVLHYLPEFSQDH